MISLLVLLCTYAANESTLLVSLFSSILMSKAWRLSVVPAMIYNSLLIHAVNSYVLKIL